MEVFTRTDSSTHDLPMQNMLRSTSVEKSIAVESARVNRALNVQWYTDVPVHLISQPASGIPTYQ